MIRKTWQGVFGVLGSVLLLVAVPALAQDGQGQNGQGQNEQGRKRRAPEFDPAVAGAIGALLAGGSVLLARRRSR